MVGVDIPESSPQDASDFKPLLPRREIFSIYPLSSRAIFLPSKPGQMSTPLPAREGNGLRFTNSIFPRIPLSPFFFIPQPTSLKKTLEEL